MEMNYPDQANVLACLDICLSDADYTKFFPALNEEGRNRMKKIESGLKKSLVQIQKIYDLAQEKNDSRLLDLLCEQFEFGADVT